MPNRELFIGLGGTGGNTLRLLYKRMNDEQRRNARYVYIDTDQNDINDMREEGIRAFAISSADTVGQVANALGREVFDWLPSSLREAKFLNSDISKGASQCRFKSRLCFARFLSSGASDLQNLLVEMTPPGFATENNRLRVVIVSSIAGGTGAGTFIQMALYIRKFFRDLKQSAEIIGILSCPDLYRNLAKNDTERVSMYANAYAAIRELNAMNLATNPTSDPLAPEEGANGNQRGTVGHLQGYGDNIHMKLRSKSEGVLFDSTDADFRLDESAKPFDLIYFVDKANERGGILRDIHEYYRVMADIAFTRLYSPLNGIIESGESNELRNHIMVPTAIYGSAGYAQIKYPYDEIVHYLAERKLLDELDARWQYLDSLWTATCEQEQDAARKYGYHWTPQLGQRGKRYREDLDAKMLEENSGFAFLKSMIYGSDFNSRVEDFLVAVNDEAMSLPGGQDGSALSSGHDALRHCGGQFCALRDSAVLTALNNLLEVANSSASGDKPFNSLLLVSSQIEASWHSLASALENAVKTLAYKLSAAILPLTEIAIRNENKKSPISLRYALLSREGAGDVHPLAARYLLYGLQEVCQGEDSHNDGELEAALNKIYRKVQLAFDSDIDDEYDITVKMVVEQNQSKFRSARSKAALADEMLDTYRDNLRAFLAEALQVTDNAIVSGAFRLLKEPIDTLIALYEGFFSSIGTYERTLVQQTTAHLNCHDSTGNQTIFVGASSRSKRYYTVDPSVDAALNSDPDKAYAAAGAGVYESLAARMQKQLVKTAQAMRLGDAAPISEEFDDMGSIFDAIIANYEEQLRGSNTILNTDVFGAMINDVCVELGISADKIEANRVRFDQKLRERIDNLRAKARPMIRYNENNTQKYFTAETETALYDVSKSYCHFGLSPTTVERIRDYYNTAGDNDLSAFRSSMGMAAWDGLAVNPEYSKFEIFCFGAVHCLQPTQLYHFNEQESEESYYPEYKKRISSGLESDSPHLDKRWNRRGAMPYISPSLELAWRRRVMKAMLYEFLHGAISFTVDRNRAKCFVRRESDGQKFLYWPQGELILTRNISRLVEYLSDDEERIDLEAEKLDSIVQKAVSGLSNYAEAPELYKQGMTKNNLLSLLRKDTVAFLQTERTVRPRRDELLDEEDTVELAVSMGSVLHVAYLLHSSEERLVEDKDYGETLLQTVAEIIDRFAQGMYGQAQTGRNAAHRREYVDIYNWTVKKFFEDWLILTGKAPLAGSADEAPAPTRSNRLVEEEDTVRSGGAFEVPDQLRNSPEYIWISNNWKCKPFQEADR